MQDWLVVTDPKMEAVERALRIWHTTSLDQLFQDGDCSTLHELIAGDQNSNNLFRLDCDLAAEAIGQGDSHAYWSQPSSPQRLRLFTKTLNELREQCALEGLEA